MKRYKILLILSLVLLAFSYWWVNRWQYIVIHHSAGNYGNIEFLQKVHRERQSKDPIGAIPYHYIVGNGNGLGVGVVKSDWRKTWHLWAMHVSGNNFNRNFRGLGICLIGNFEERDIDPKQYNALVKLTKELMRKYKIPVKNIPGHGYIEKEATKCPGKKFPMEQFLKDIEK